MRQPALRVRASRGFATSAGAGVLAAAWEGVTLWSEGEVREAAEAAIGLPKEAPPGQRALPRQQQLPQQLSIRHDGICPVPLSLRASISRVRGLTMHLMTQPTAAAGGSIQGSPPSRGAHKSK